MSQSANWEVKTIPIRGQWMNNETTITSSVCEGHKSSSQASLNDRLLLCNKWTTRVVHEKKQTSHMKQEMHECFRNWNVKANFRCCSWTQSISFHGAAAQGSENAYSNQHSRLCDVLEILAYIHWGATWWRKKNKKKGWCSKKQVETFMRTATTLTLLVFLAKLFTLT